MSHAAPTHPTPTWSPLRLDSRSRPVQLLAVLVGTMALALSSYVSVPMVPVPMTMQTYAVTLIGALYGWRLGGLTVLAWLGEAALGLPVLSGGAGGITPFFGPTGGYLFAFPLMAVLTGWLAERGWNGHRVVLAFCAMLMGNALCLALGAAWLASLIGLAPAIAAGVTPFILGGIVKSALGAATLKALAMRPATR
ncbi:biotin transporter BioY [Rhodoligotrophos defluvii]|uniref:biotin transporter BioY n=1 Tax=Rhodoligotrophos defluvii TaxID=2561934 RepID=UPI0010C99B8D|nr:biotin transporter BioY [Rhodoligotrophos defluvii]